MSRALRARRRPARWLPRRLRRTAGLALLALTPGLGCGREFFRQWADQDVTEAVFEKSRDPRWKLPTFTVEPPAMSRFADSYDVDRPAAPPDDYATEALSPYPQKPHIRLLTPLEGTGYVEMLDAGTRYEPPPSIEEQLRAAGASTGGPAPAPLDEGGLPGAEPPASPNPSPFGPDVLIPGQAPQNSGPVPGAMTPNSSDEAPPSPVPGVNPDASDSPQTGSPKRDPGVLSAAFQAPSTPPANLAEPAPLPGSTPGGELAPGTGGPAQVPEIIDPQDLAPRGTQDILPGPIGQPGADQGEVGYATSDFASQLSPQYVEYNQATTAGLPADSRPYVVGPAQALQLALINSRAYQFQIETIYLNSLNVTLARFGFEPQFFASFGGVPTAPAAGLPPGVGGASSFNYRSREAPGGQLSQLNLTTAAGFGKVFVFGGRFLAAFANTTVFNFVGNNPSQPTVSSSLPLSFVQPFLRNGGRAVVLEPLTQAERTLLYSIRDFARFRQLFFVSTLTQGQPLGGAGGAADPSPGLLSVLQQYQVAENNRYIVAAYERTLQIFQEYAKGGAASGISQLQVDQIDQNLQNARFSLINAQTQFRNTLDQFKQQLGLPPDLPMIPDRSLLDGFRNVFKELDSWQRRPNHSPEELDAILAGLPSLDNVVLDGRPLFDLSGPVPQPVYADTERQEEFLLTAERIALENRLDLMNQRAILYDLWRQIAVQANSLLPVLTVNFSNQLLTPPTTTNPFAFTSQSFSSQLSLQTELPLIRVAERNNFRTALINYQRQRRILMQQEDSVKFAVRQEVRLLIQFMENYQITKQNLLLALRQRDQSLQQIVAPPDQGAGGGGAATSQAIQTQNFILAVNQILNNLNNLIQTWVSYQTQRLALYRDLGIMPYDEWEAYFELFPASAGAPAAQPGPGGPPAGGAPDVIPTPDLQP